MDHSERGNHCGKPDKGWYKSDWADVWKRYLVTDYTPVTTDTLVTMVTEENEELAKAYEGKITPEVCKQIMDELATEGKTTWTGYQTRRKELGMPYNHDIEVEQTYSHFHPPSPWVHQ